MASTKRESAFILYLILAALFIASLVTCNLIFAKFFFWQPLEDIPFIFELSVGIIPYPVTFLITDLISELFGRKRANQVVLAGLVASVFTYLIVIVANYAPATDYSPVSDEQFTDVFGRTGIAVLASMLAYLGAQFIDIRIFHFWKNLTKGKHLWLRNNFSTVFSQFVDTFIVLLLLCLGKAIPWDKFWMLLLNGFLFKVMVALLDTPIFYFTSWWARKHFRLKMGEEIDL